MEFEGQPHSGLDDAKNIARIVVRLLKDRAVIRVNEKIQKVAHGVDDSNRCNGKLFSVVPVNRKDAESWIKTQKKKIIKSQNPPSSWWRLKLWNNNLYFCSIYLPLSILTDIIPHCFELYQINLEPNKIKFQMKHICIIIRQIGRWKQIIWFLFSRCA